MNEKIAIGGLVFTVMLLGFGQAILRLRELAKREQFANTYLTKLREYLESNGNAFGVYLWLTQKSMKMQRHLGSTGLLHHFKPAFANYSINNYPLLINHLPKLHSLFGDPINDFTGQAAHYRNAIIECLVRHMGDLEEERESIVTTLKNPLAWFGTGVTLVVSLPLILLGALGIIGATTIEMVTSNRLFKMVASFAALVGFASAVIGIVTGWEQFIVWLRAHRL